VASEIGVHEATRFGFMRPGIAHAAAHVGAVSDVIPYLENPAGRVTPQAMLAWLGEAAARSVLFLFSASGVGRQRNLKNGMWHWCLRRKFRNDL
jgi:hypothetical protein